MARRRTQSRTFRLGASLLVFVAFLLVGEGVARGLGVVSPAWQAADPGDVIMIGHPTRLWGMGEGRRQNAGSIATINALGLRGDKPRLPRPAGRQRVLVTGDSSFFGHGVPDDQTPAALLGERLRAAGVDADTVNGAVPGYSTEQTRLLLDEVGWSLEPTLLVVCNAWSDYNFDHFRDEDLLRTQQAFGRGILAQSSLFRLVAAGVDRARGGDGAHLVSWTRHSSWPTSGVRRVPPRRYAENLDTIVREAATRGVGVVLLTPTNRDMARGDLTGAEVRAPYFDAQAAVAAWHGVPRVETLAAFTTAAAAAGPDTLFLDDLHPSAAGNAVVADTIVTALTAAGWPGTPLVGRSDPFDASGVVDTAPGSLGASPGAMSPQVNLFPGGATSLARQTADAGHGSVGADATAAWTVRGSVTAPPGPIEVTVRDLGDVKLAAAVLRGDTTFVLEVPAGHARVRVEVMAAGGREVVEATPDGGAVVVTLGR